MHWLRATLHFLSTHLISQDIYIIDIILHWTKIVIIMYSVYKSLFGSSFGLAEHTVVINFSHTYLCGGVSLCTMTCGKLSASRSIDGGSCRYVLKSRTKQTKQLPLPYLLTYKTSYIMHKLHYAQAGWGITI